MKTRRMRGFLPAASLLLLGALAYPSSAPGQAAEAVLDLLHPGSRSSLGLGGDPFLSPLDDEVGWWARARTITGGEVRLDVRDYAPLPEHANSQRGALYARRTRVSVSRRLPYGTRSVALTARIESPSTALSVGQADGSLRMSSSGSVAQGYLRLMDLWPGATLQAEIPLWTEPVLGSGPRGGIGLRGRCRSIFEYQGTYAQSKRPLGGLGFLLDEPVPFDLNLWQESYAYDLRFTPYGGVQIEASIGLAHLSMIDRPNDAGEYVLVPEGRKESWQCALVVQPLSGQRVLVRQSRARLHSNARLHLAGMQFGRLSYLRADLRSWLIAWEMTASAGTRLLVDVEFARPYGETYGYLESWPFTSGVVDLLGIQQNFRARGEAHMTRWHAALADKIGNTGFECGLNFYDIDPELQLMTWQPVIFGMGWNDVHRYALRSARVHLAAVSLGLSHRLLGCDVHLAWQQFVYARSAGHLEHINEDEQVTESDLQVAKSAGRSRAGTFLDLGVSYRF